MYAGYRQLDFGLTAPERRVCEYYRPLISSPGSRTAQSADCV